MADAPYLFSPAPEYHEYKVTSLMKGYLSTLVDQPENQEYIEQILSLIRSYTEQLKNLRLQNRLDTTREVYKAIDEYFESAPEENKKDIQCSSGCTACCFIDIDVSHDEAAIIINYCKENNTPIDRDYLLEQASVGRKNFSALSRCVFLKNNLCSIYPVRPIACRKHWVKTDPVLCDFSNNIINPVGEYFDINSEILASAVLNVDRYEPLEKALLHELGENCS